MSAADVQFHKTHRYEEPGTPEAAVGEEQAFSFRCPKWDRRCGKLCIAGRTNLKHDPNGKNGGFPHWMWDGNREAPTLVPSVNCSSCWHGYIRAGRCVDTNGNDEPEPAQH